MTNGPISSTAWYQESYVWMVIAIPATAVVVCAVLLTAAIVSHDGVVVDDYYKQGLQINRTLARDDRATVLGLAATLDWSPEAGTVTVAIAGQGAFFPPDALTMDVVHPTRAGSDHQITLTRTPDGRYFGVLPRLARGLYHVEVAADDWRVITEIDARD